MHPNVKLIRNLEVEKEFRDRVMVRVRVTVRVGVRVARVKEISDGTASNDIAHKTVTVARHDGLIYLLL